MDCLLISFGSAGDIHPFVGLGRALKSRGHQVTLLSYPAFAGMVQAAGLDFVELPKPDKQAFWRSQNPRGSRRWLNSALNPIVRPWRRLARASTIVPMLQPVYDSIASRFVPGRTVVVASGPALGARVAQDRLGVPLVTIHFAPVALRSIYRTPIQPPLQLPSWSPRWSRRLAYRLLDEWVLDPLLGQPVNALRSEVGLPPLNRPVADWLHSPQQVIGLFPHWFAKPSPDWPMQTALTGFPLFDEAGLAVMPPSLANFLRSGSAPILFTPGSAEQDGKRFFSAALQACQALKKRGLFLTRFKEQIPATLPADVCHVDYVPFSLLFPRCGAVVYHAGVGTAAQALAAGVPQVVVPRRHDQWDNARRLTDLGVARQISPRRFGAKPLIAALGQLVASESIKKRCRDLARRIAAADPLAETCRLIEQAIEGKRAA
jgi:UDP:flavonoid glycosyltransferase YjiC (YdhE family)